MCHSESLYLGKESSELKELLNANTSALSPKYLKDETWNLNINYIFVWVSYYIFRKDCFKVAASSSFLKDHELNDLTIAAKIHAIQGNSVGALVFFP